MRISQDSQWFETASKQTVRVVRASAKHVAYVPVEGIVNPPAVLMHNSRTDFLNRFIPFEDHIRIRLAELQREVDARPFVPLGPSPIPPHVKFMSDASNGRFPSEPKTYWDLKAGDIHMFNGARVKLVRITAHERGQTWTVREVGSVKAGATAPFVIDPIFLDLLSLDPEVK